MDSYQIGLVAVFFLSLGAVSGFALSRALPQHHLSSDSKDTVKIASGMIATLSALILGLLVASAKNSFDTVTTETTQAGAKIIMLDRTLAKFGPETQDARKELKISVLTALHKIWPEAGTEVPPVDPEDKSVGLEKVQKAIYALNPTNETQHMMLAQAEHLADDLVQSRWLLLEQRDQSVPTAFYVILLFWLTVLFLSIGLFAPHNHTVYIALGVCILSFSAAIFLFDEMNGPLDGMIKVSSGPLVKALHQLGQ